MKADGCVHLVFFQAFAAVALVISAAGQSTHMYTLPQAPYSYPNAIVGGPDGAMWFTLGTNGGAFIGRITMNGNISEYPIPYSGSYPTFITAGSDGNIWFIDTGTYSIGQVRVGTKPVIVEKPMMSPDADIGALTAGQDGSLWYTEGTLNKIVRVKTNWEMAEFPVPTANSRPQGITAGPDEAIWFTEEVGNKIGRISTSGNVTDEFALPMPKSFPSAITTGPDGSVWFVEPRRGLGRIGSSHKVYEFPFATADDDFLPTIAAGPDGGLYFIDLQSVYYPILGTFKPGEGTPEYFDVGSWPQQLTSGPDGSVWLAEWYGWIVRFGPKWQRNGVDMSASAGVPSPATLKQFAESGIRYAAVEAPQIPDSGLARKQMDALTSAGIQTSAYCFLYFYASADSGKTQVDSCLASITGAASAPRFVALDVEYTKAPLAPVATRTAIIRDAIQEAKAKGFSRVVIYTFASAWDTLVGGDTEFASYPLWNAAHGGFISYTDPAGAYGCATNSGNREKALTPQLHGGTGLPSLSPPAAITGFSISDHVATFQSSNSFLAGQSITISGMKSESAFDGKEFSVLASGLSSTQFEVGGSLPSMAYTVTTGEAALTLFGGWTTQSAVQYDIGGGDGVLAQCLFGTQVDFDRFNPALFQ